MASISVRGRYWRARITYGDRVFSKTFDTKREAEEWATAEEERIRSGIEPRSTELTCRQLFERYAAEVSPAKGGVKWELIRLRRFGREFEGPAAALDGPTLADWRDARLRDVSPASVNRDLNLIGAVWTRAIKEWRLGLTINPVHQIQRPRNPAHRTRRVSDDELAAVIAALGWKRDRAPETLRQWIAWTAAFAVETAMRRGEILGMEWRHVHARHVHLPRTKNGTTRDVPLSSKARALLDMLTPGAGAVAGMVPTTHLSYWKVATAKAGLRDMHFHDLRREATTRMAPKFRDAMELSRVTGHRDLRSLGVYFQPDVEDLSRKLD
jgi:integrase